MPTTQIILQPPLVLRPRALGISSFGFSPQPPPKAAALLMPLHHRRRSPLLPRAASSVRLTISDDELASRGFTVRRTAEGIDVAALNEVFARVGFPRRQEDRLRRALEHSRVVWLSASPEGERPVAFARAAGDGVFNAVVWDVVVEPSCQGLGLGRAVMERLVDDLRNDGVNNIVLYAEPRVVGFYRLLDFAMDPDGIRGMAYYHRKTTTASPAPSSSSLLL
ncbi:hypothetical protein HU200_028320 [Digitaria exilis]|uniref:aralkylamine N-acetyltransferase n=1 Tax=Digitaria exilis TaxID=1010633 RepID=A0A835BV11_9POAL|nr:hypothetical protein HU200_028320 [Digitaria exilis]CAB3481789.1 unnamed protein product [Digitaria exilis]